MISNDKFHDNAKHGISVSRSDMITIEGNVTHHNARTGFYSGISVYHRRN